MSFQIICSIIHLRLIPTNLLRNVQRLNIVSRYVPDIALIKKGDLYQMPKICHYVTSKRIILIISVVIIITHVDGKKMDGIWMVIGIIN